MRKLFAITALLLSAAAGCRMCSSPYDYCGPVIEDQGAPSCGYGGSSGDYAAAHNHGGPQSQGMATSQPSSSQGQTMMGSNSSNMMR